jgi:polysaccharide pyruvyl transferase WcaK-like protein
VRAIPVLKDGFIHGSNELNPDCLVSEFISSTSFCNLEQNMRIFIMGTPVASGNRGVMALGASIVDLCLAAAPDADVRYLLVHKPWQDVKVRTQSGVQMVPVTTCRMSHRSALRDHLLWILILSMVYRFVPSRKVRDVIGKQTPWIAAVAAADLVGDVRGGDSFSDIYGLKRFILAFLPVLSVILIKGSIAHLPQTYGPFRTRTARCMARFLLRRSSVVIARDLESQRIAQELVGSRLKVRLSPDVAFALHSEAPEEIATEPQLVGNLSPGTIGLNVNGLMFNGGYHGGNMFGLKLDYRAFLPALINRLLSETEVEILLVPHTLAEPGDPESDNEACRLVRDLLPSGQQERVRIVTGDYDAHQLKGIIRQCDFFIGSRMHSCIAALSQGVPCVGVAYSMKFAGVFESVGMKDWVIDGRVTDCEPTIDTILNLYQKRDAVRVGLGSAAADARRSLREIFREMVSGVPAKKSAEVTPAAATAVSAR